MVAGYGNAVADDLSSDVIMRRGDGYRTRDMVSSRRDSQIRRAPTSAGLYEVLDLILDKGIVVDAFVRVSLVGIELLTVDLRVVIASVDTYLRYAEGVERLQVRGDERSEPKNLPGMVGGGMKAHAVKSGAKSVGRMLTGGGDDEKDDAGREGVVGTLTRGVRHAVGKVATALTGDEDEDEGGEGDERRAGGDRDRGQQKSNGGGRRPPAGNRR